jgi:succinate dehydrogenase/fumarate reductase cytochrome b subunit
MATEQNDELSKEKKLAYFQALLSAYTENSFEKDRSLLTLSSGAIGLLITLLTSVGINSVAELVLYILSFLAFGACIVLLLHVFTSNRELLLKIANEEKIVDNKLQKLDQTVFVLFLVGIVLFFSIGVISGVNQIKHKEDQHMAEESKKPEHLIESLNGIQKLDPGGKAIKSLQGLELLNPDSTTTQTNQSNANTEKPAANNNSTTTQSDKK